MLFAESVAIPGEVLFLALVVFLVACLACVSVLAGTIVAARRYGRTGSRASAVVATLGAGAEFVVLVLGVMHRSPAAIVIAGGALAAAGAAYATARRSPVPS